MRARLVWSAILVIAFVLAMFCSASAQVPQIPSFILSSQKIMQGDVLVVTLSPHARAPRVLIDVFGTYYYPNENGIVYIGINAETEPDEYRICLLDHFVYWYCTEFEVEKAEFKEVNIPRNRITDPNFPLKKVNEETVAKTRAFGRAEIYQDYTSGSYAYPVPSSHDVSGEFGTKRVYKDGSTTVHKGVDLEVPVGTKVLAINFGEVLMVAEGFYFEGNMVVIDHGSGVLSLYMHLSKILVKEGDMVTSGQPIALSGGSGLVTGPHLHLATRIHGTYVDPFLFTAAMNNR